MKIYNTLTKKTEEFHSNVPNEVGIYVCGPTVYDYFHIGNARSFIMADIIRRYFEYKAFKVTYVMNLTDIDDKIIKKAQNENLAFREISEKYINAFFSDLEKLKVKKADFYPRPTENIDEIIELIKRLIEKEIAYNVDGNVFYDVSRFPEYGKLSGKKIDELESGSRVEINIQKKNPLDFALWKKAKEGEPFWNSPWGKGRPGWHVECSAMSMKYLNTPIDIHAGGSDLIFPHHENEIAQSEAVIGKNFVNYWMHFGFLNIQNEKMSKSTGNFFTAREILIKYSAEAIRLFFAQTHYAGPLNFSEDVLFGAQKGLEKLTNLIEKVEDQLKLKNHSSIIPEFEFSKYKIDFESAMDDNFNTPQAIAVIFDFIREINKIISENDDNLDFSFYQKIKDFLVPTTGNVLGILVWGNQEATFQESREDELIKLLIKLRLNAKQEKNFVLADKIRDELKNLGVILKDEKDKTTYKKQKLLEI
ncbi:MAG: cysteine--tRNA ligase [Ignavibacteriales bacterium]|nr:cysteine--tRNA ligase [Ignavibacteriales bacterium]